MTIESPYEPRKVVRKILNTLTEGKIETPTGISRKTGYDKRTVSKYMDMLEDMGVTSCQKIPLGKRQIRACRISERFKGKEGDK